jgi:hypothetical protein
MKLGMMRKALFMALVLMTGLLQAQTDTDTLFMEDEIINPVAPPSTDRDRFVFSAHWDGWLGAPDSLEVGPLSRGVGLHFYYDIPFDAAKRYSFAVGLGWNNMNYYTKALFANDTLGNTLIVPFDASQTVSRNKISLNYVEVPLEFRLRTKPNQKGNSFKVAIGFKAGYEFSNHTKYIGDEYKLDENNQIASINNSTEIKYKFYNYSSLSSLQYGPTLRIGYANVNLEAFYGLATTFQDGQGPTGSPLQIGVSFNPF